ncbi:MAG: helix-turn-helix domain-containing protein [Fibrobacter sp.]|nr:helix-turn-helix domain-containing protein [Fibrobacter sp.]MCQ2124100.1 helix-turn-helix domain-containing protein [Fibrobacter sp.]
MEKAKKERLEKNGWKVGDIDEFLDLNEAEMAIIEMKVALAKALVAKRKKSGLSQEEVARMSGTSQSRLAKMEKANSSVSLELLIRALFSLGSSKKELLKAMAG